jgi:hypothetical protein
LTNTIPIALSASMSRKNKIKESRIHIIDNN